MFKTAFVLSLALLAGSAMATPKIGDQANFSLTISKAGQTIPGAISFELTQFDASRNQFLQHQVTQVQGGQTQTQDNWVSANDMLTDEKIDAVIANCVRAGGQNQSIQVPAGTYPTCALPINGNDGTKGVVWVAKVPLGLVRFDSTNNDGVTVSALLASFRAGN